jgi:FkbM family methyltransferase
VKLLKSVLKIPLDALAFGLRRSHDALYYLVNEALRDEIKTVGEQVHAYEHIENACKIAKQRNIVIARHEATEGSILDVGGGQATTAQLFSRYFPTAPVYIFEPILSNFKEIEKQAVGQTTWRLVNKAVGSSVGETFINIASHVTASSLLEMNADAEGYGNLLVTEKKEAIKVTTLDAEIPNNMPISILKMDVQGFELEVLKGATETLKRTEIVILEINNHDGYKNAPTYFELDEFLRQANFQLHDLLPNVRINGKLQDWDAIYVKNHGITA